MVSSHLGQFLYLFSKPQLKHFDEYLTGLIVCDNINIKQINNTLVNKTFTLLAQKKSLFLCSSRRRWSGQIVLEGRIVGSIDNKIQPDNNGGV